MAEPALDAQPTRRVQFDQRTFASPKPERAKLVEAMLYRLRDAMDLPGGQEATGTPDSRALEFTPAYNQAFRELTRCLDILRFYEPHLHFHVRAWYVDCDWKQEEQHRWVIHGGKRKKVHAGWRMVPRPLPGASESKAVQAVRMLAGWYRFERIPLKLQREAAGDTT